MATVQRYNVILQVADDADTIQRYMDKGFNVIDGKGHVIKEALPNEVGALQAKVVKLQKEIAELKVKLALTENVVEPVKVSKLIETDNSEPIVERPKRGRKKKN